MDLESYDVESYVYGPEIFISPHTNMPISTTTEKRPIFWCDICNLKLSTVHTTIQHLSGRVHKAKLNAKNDPANKNKRKQGLNSSNLKPTDLTVQEPATKKSKEQPGKTDASDPNLKCDDCNLVFVSTKTAIHHFKGKRHALSVAAKIVSKQNQRGGQRGGRGQGRGVGFGRGYGLTRGGINRDGRPGEGYEAGQLVRALQMFYGEPLNSGVNFPMYGSNYGNIHPLPAPKDNFRGVNDNYYSDGDRKNNYSVF